MAYCVPVARDFSVVLIYRSHRYFTRIVQYFVISLDIILEARTLALMPAANPLPINAKLRDRPMGTQQASSITLGAAAQG